MAMFHSHVQVISRSQGRSAVAAAAYRSGECITCERDGITHDYTAKSGIAHAEIVLPENAPERFADRSTLWNEVERVEKGSNAQLCREINYALPVEFSEAQRVKFAREYAQTFADEGMVVDFAIHYGKGGNPHVHQMMTMRPCDRNGFLPKSENVYTVRNAQGEERQATARELKELGGDWSKVYRYRNGGEMTKAEAEAAGLDPIKDRRSKSPVQTTHYTIDWNDKSNADVWRERLASMQNERLEDMGEASRVDHRSYEEQGIDQVPTLHEGPTVRASEAAAERLAAIEGREYVPVTDRRRENVRIKKLNEEIEEMKARLIELKETLKRSYTDFRRSMTAAASKGASGADKRRRQQQARSKTGAKAQRQRGGLGK